MDRRFQTDAGGGDQDSRAEGGIFQYRQLTMRSSRMLSTNISLSAYILEDSPKLLSAYQLYFMRASDSSTCLLERQCLFPLAGGVVECMVLEGFPRIDFNRPKCCP